MIMGVKKDCRTVSEGIYTNIIAVKGDVLQYISLLQDVDFVMKKGQMI